MRKMIRSNGGGDMAEQEEEEMINTCHSSPIPLLVLRNFCYRVKFHRNSYIDIIHTHRSPSCLLSWLLHGCWTNQHRIVMGPGHNESFKYSKTHLPFICPSPIPLHLMTCCRRASFSLSLSVCMCIDTDSWIRALEKWETYSLNSWRIVYSFVFLYHRIPLFLVPPLKIYVIMDPGHYNIWQFQVRREKWFFFWLVA